MSESCCGKPFADNGSHATHNDGNNNHSGHAHNGNHTGHAHNDSHHHSDSQAPNSGGCCDDGDSASVLTETSTCCGDQENCDGRPSEHTLCSEFMISLYTILTNITEKCIRAIAAVECQNTCEKSYDHESKSIHFPCQNVYGMLTKMQNP